MNPTIVQGMKFTAEAGGIAFVPEKMTGKLSEEKGIVSIQVSVKEVWIKISLLDVSHKLLAPLLCFLMFVVPDVPVLILNP